MPTSQPTSPVDICNLALDYIGELPIASIETPGNAREEIMARWYDHVRMTVLREYVWNFCQKYRVIARTGDGEGQHADSYLMPTDCVRLNSVGSDVYNPVTEYDLSEGYLLASQGTSIPIRYNLNVTEVSKMDTLFVNIFALRLALKVAYKFTKKKSVAEYMNQLLSIEEGKAISVDGQERPPRRIQHSKYLKARRMGGVLGRDNRYYHYS